MDTAHYSLLDQYLIPTWTSDSIARCSSTFSVLGINQLAAKGSSSSVGGTALKLLWSRPLMHLHVWARAFFKVDIHKVNDTLETMCMFNALLWHDSPEGLPLPFSSCASIEDPRTVLGVRCLQQLSSIEGLRRAIPSQHGYGKSPLLIFFMIRSHRSGDSSDCFSSSSSHAVCGGGGGHFLCRTAETTDLLRPSCGMGILQCLAWRLVQCQRSSQIAHALASLHRNSKLSLDGCGRALVARTSQACAERMAAYMLQVRKQSQETWASDFQGPGASLDPPFTWLSHPGIDCHWKTSSEYRSFVPPSS